VYALGATLYYLLHGKRPVSAVHRASGTALLMSKQLSQGVKDIINASMKLSKRERAKSMNVFLKENYFPKQETNSFDTSVTDDEETIIEKPIRQNSVTEVNEGSSTWKYIIGALLITALIAGYIYYNNVSSQNNKPQIEKASYQDFFDK
jgi:uncharacterized membrane protein YraQ (UPF0718 family)